MLKAVASAYLRRPLRVITQTRQVLTVTVRKSQLKGRALGRIVGLSPLVWPDQASDERCVNALSFSQHNFGLKLLVFRCERENEKLAAK